MNGGAWRHEILAGITHRIMYVSPTGSPNDVASVCRHLKYSSNYTDWHNVDEDFKSDSMHGGRQENGIQAGVMYRDMISISDVYGSYGTVASVQKKINRTYSPRGDACSIAEDR